MFVQLFFHWLKKDNYLSLLSVTLLKFLSSRWFSYISMAAFNKPIKLIPKINKPKEISCCTEASDKKNPVIPPNINRRVQKLITIRKALPFKVA
jgi:hypothetical protein